MSELGHLCRSASSNSLLWKQGGAYEYYLVYKIRKGGDTIISFAWGVDGDDLDICAYWIGAKTSATDRTSYVGYGWKYNAAGTYYVYSKTVDDVTYYIGYYGDERGTNNSERIKVWKSNWSRGSNVLRVHLNFYGWNATTYPETDCDVIAAQEGGQTLTCPAHTNQKNGKAFDTDPYVDVTFDTTGRLVSVAAGA